MTIGQRVVQRYIKHPSGGSFVNDGRPLGANVAMIIDSNLSWLEYEGVRNLCCGLGPGAVTTYQSTSAPFSGLTDVIDAPTDSGSPATHAEIPWDHRTSIRRGPFYLVADRDVSSPAAAITLRKVKCELMVTVQATTTSFDGYFALTQSASAADLAAGNYLAFSKQSTSSTGQQPLRATLEATAERFAESVVQCRPDSDGVPSLVRVVACWVWFGWRPRAGSALTSNSVDTYSAFETR